MQQNLLLADMIFKKKEEDLYLKASKLAFENAKIIYDEAKLLNNEGHSARGFTLSIISLEESAKAFLLRLISLNLVDERKTMNFVRKHDTKLLQSSQILSFSFNLASIILDYVKIAQEQGYIKTKVPIPEQYKKNVKAWSELAKMVANFHRIRLDSIYVDVREGKIIDPNDMFKKEPVSEILELVEMQITVVKVFINMPNSQFLEVWKEPLASQLNMEYFSKP